MTRTRADGEIVRGSGENRRDATARGSKARPSGRGRRSEGSERPASRPLERLQRVEGNQAVQRAVEAYRRSERSASDRSSRSEREADRLAAAATRPGGGLAGPPPASAVANSGATDGGPDGRRTARGDGRPLPGAVRTLFERRFGRTLPDVRVHDDTGAATMADAIDARAFTFGSDVFFGAGQYRPETAAGRGLLAHELAHVLQQTGGSRRIQRQSTLGPANVYPAYGESDLSRLSDDELEAEIHGIREWLAENQVGTAETEQAAQTLATLESEARRRTPEPTLSGSEPEPPVRERSGVVVGALLGEFEPDPTVGSILLDTGLGLIPIVDQALDVRDVAAHIYWMAEKGEYDKTVRWLGLVISLVGAIPEIGSLIKGGLKLVLKGVGAVVSSLGDLLDLGRRFLPEGVSSLARFRRSLAENWGRFVARGTDIWRETMAFLRRRMDEFSLLVSDRLESAIDRIARLGRERIPESFRRLIRQVDDVLAAALERLGIRPDGFGGLQPAMAGAGGSGARTAPSSVPSGAEPMRMSGGKGGGGSSSTTATPTSGSRTAETAASASSRLPYRKVAGAVATSRRAFMRSQLRVILNALDQGKKHPLGFLVDPKTRNWRGRSHLSEEPSVQAGHLTSRHSGAPERFAVEDAFFNQVSNWKGETQGAIFMKEAVEIEGVVVEARTAELWVGMGLLP